MQLATLVNLLTKAQPADAGTPNARDGMVEVGWDSTYHMPVVYMYAYAHATLTINAPYAIEYDAAGDGRWETVAPPIGAGLLGIATAATASGSVAKLIIAGPAHDVVTSGTVVTGDHMEVLDATAAAIADGTSGSTVRTVRSFARSLATTVSNTTDLLLYGDVVTVADT